MNYVYQDLDVTYLEYPCKRDQIIDDSFHLYSLLNDDIYGLQLILLKLR